MSPFGVALSLTLPTRIATVPAGGVEPPRDPTDRRKDGPGARHRKDSCAYLTLDRVHDADGPVVLGDLLQLARLPNADRLVALLSVRGVVPIMLELGLWTPICNPSPLGPPSTPLDPLPSLAADATMDDEREDAL